MKNTIEIKTADFIKTYNAADAVHKNLLESLAPDFIPRDIKDRIKSFEDACAALGITPTSVINSNDTKDEIAYKKIKIIARALNEGWIPDWANSNQYKYHPWFKHKAGFGLSYDDYDGWLTGTTVGSRLCFKSAELAEYAGTQFEEIYRDFLSL